MYYLLLLPLLLCIKLKKQIIMQENEIDQNFKFASSLVKIISVVIALMVIVMSRYAFIFFTAAMLPTIFAIFLDKNAHRCLSATVCSFNLMGVMPYLVKIWEANSIDYLAKNLLADVSTWMIVYGVALFGMLLYITVPLLVVGIYATKTKRRIENYKKQHKKLCEEWDIKYN